MSNEKIIMQQQFEEWARSQCMQLKKDGVVTTYAYERTDLAWQAWQASREALVIELPAEVTREHYNDESMANGFNDGVESCRDAIEARGVRVSQ